MKDSQSMRYPANINVQKCRETHGKELDKLEHYFRFVNYLAAAQLYLKENFFLDEPLKAEHIKDRLLGHWGTSPGINLIYTHLNRLIRANDLNMFLVTGPGHGAPANLANLFLEGSLSVFYSELAVNKNGIENLIKRFSWPGGFPSHLFPGIPGTIHEGGELGYSLATSFGAIMDNPDLIVACIVGDGEAETGPTATAWHSYKFIDPKESGAVLPILHLNGYKISNPTIYGTMSDKELFHLFTGYGYQVRIVEDEDLHADLFASLDWALSEIHAIQKKAREGHSPSKPKWPLLILRSLKGWTGIKKIDGVKIEGSCRSHQIPAKDAKTNAKHRKQVEEWLRSYHLHELLNSDGSPKKEILEVCPKGKQRMGMNPHTFGGDIHVKLKRPDINLFAIPPPKNPCARGETLTSNVARVADYLEKILELNPKTFRIFSPDELESNKLGAVFETTSRDYQWPIKSYDTNISSHGGRVCEILSEHTCQGWLQGYLLTGRNGLFPSYEAFLAIAATMMEQFAKFLKFSREFSWRKPIASLNYLETSTLWRQEHNGFSHQSPGFINILLNKKGNILRIYFPPDANTLTSTFDHCLQSMGYINLIVAGKQEMPQWLSMDEAVAHCRAGGTVWKWASSDEGIDPDVVLVGIGDVPHLEVMAAAHILRAELPALRVRVVNITDLLILEKETAHPHGLDDQMFDALFTTDKPVIINFHGYPSAIKQLLFSRNVSDRFHINGYQEEGSTTTPFDMCVRNKISRFHLIMQAIRLVGPTNPAISAVANERISHYEYVLASFKEYIQKHGSDPEQITKWHWC